MPIYEFYCKETHTIYSFLSQRSLSPEEVPRCPDGSSHKLQRMISPFSVTGRHKEREEFGDDMDPDDPRMDAAMAELEKEMSGMDEDNPDPRSMGKLMRRMAEISGEPLGGQMEEMVRKMEEGVDLETLEEDFGEAMDEDGLDAPIEGASSGKAALRRLLQARRKEPRKDPELYDWRDYADS